MLFFIIFAIFGINFLKGLLWNCLTDNSEELPGFDSIVLEDKWDCFNFGGEWVQQIQNFDNMKNSFISIISISQSISWSNIMYRTIDSRGIHHTDRQYSRPYYSVYFIIVIISGAFFIANLFAGVVVSAYNREHENIGNQYLLKDK